ncbi:MAG: hypothetical protein WBM13_00400 [Bacteroidia bacterium]
MPKSITKFFFLFSLSLSLSLFVYAGSDNNAAENNDNTDHAIIIARIKKEDIDVTIPSVIYTFNDTEIKLKFKNPEHTRLLYNNNKVNFIVNGEDMLLSFVNGECVIKKQLSTNDKYIAIYTEEFGYKQSIMPIAIWHILIPVFFLIALIVFFIARRK